MQEEQRNSVTHSDSDEFTCPIAVHRAAVNKMTVTLGIPAIDYHLEVVPSRIAPGVKVHDDSFRIGIYQPKGLSTKLHPTIFYIPGTAFTAYPRQFFHLVCSTLANKAKCQVIRIEHSIGPENNHQEALEDICELFKYFTTEPSNPLNINKDNIVLMGYSSGANFAALLQIYARKDDVLRKTINLSRVILVSPITDLSRSLTSYKTFEDKDKTVPESFVRWAIKNILPKQEHDPTGKSISPACKVASPAWIDIQDLALPPTYIVFGENDRVRSDVENYAIKLANQGIDTYMMMVSGADHSLMWQRADVIDMVAYLAKHDFNLRRVPKQVTIPLNTTPGFFSQKSTTNSEHSVVDNVNNEYLSSRPGSKL